MQQAPRLAIAQGDYHTSHCEYIAQQLQLPICTTRKHNDLPACEKYDFYLVYQDEIEQTPLSLAAPDGDLGNPFYLDFAHGALAHRRQYGGGRKQPLARAMGLKPGINPTVVDATAGLGRDSFVLATLGCQVRLIERSDVLATLLDDALQRGKGDQEIGEIIARMQLIRTNAIDWLKNCADKNRPDVVYLDPMYPHRSKSALVKKEMRVLRALVGDDEDAGELLAAALVCARKRVVVKRPKSAPPITPDAQIKLKPAAAVSSKNTRYDIYPVLN